MGSSSQMRKTGRELVLAAGQTVGQQLVVMTSELIMEKLKENGIGAVACTAIGAIGECAPDFNADFFAPLLRNDFFYLVRQYISGQIFAALEISKWVKELQTVATQKTFQILEINRKKAVDQLMAFQGYLGSHIVTRCDEFFGKSDHSMERLNTTKVK